MALGPEVRPDARGPGLMAHPSGGPLPSGYSGMDQTAYDKVILSYQYRPGWGGKLQRQNQAGYHRLSHGGAITGIALADYITPPTTGTQAGGRARLAQIFTSDYQSK